MDDLKAQMKIMYEILGDDQLTEAIAAMCWNLYNKLILKGFTPDQAIQIVTALGGNKGK